ncbi:hypothetical protein [Halosolutus gelatinilyticus]|nr:hypothetical protein [Halosolutus gelatinilyticus]
MTRNSTALRAAVSNRLESTVTAAAMFVAGRPVGDATGPITAVRWEVSG